MTLASGERVEARLGSTVPETHPELRYAWSPQHDVVYRVRAAMGESLLHPAQAYLAAVGNQPGDGATPPQH